MWKKMLIIFLLFYLFALLQNGFFAHFTLLGATPNLIFILFSLLLFFSAQGGPASGWEVFFYATLAGFFLDIYSYAYFGISIVLLIITGFLFKKTQMSLKRMDDKYPLVYFLGLFLFFFVFYRFSFLNCLHFFHPLRPVASLDFQILAEIIYSLIFSFLMFHAYKKCRRFTK